MTVAPPLAFLFFLAPLVSSVSSLASASGAVGELRSARTIDVTPAGDASDPWTSALVRRTPRQPTAVAADSMQDDVPPVKRNKKAAPVVVYGIETCSQPAFEKIVDAQLHTWAKNIPRDHLVVVGGRYDDANDGLASMHQCRDQQSSLVCKEAELFVRGIERARKLKADWLLVGQDDKYIWPAALEKELAKYDPAEPMVLGSFGCGQAWKYHPESKNGSVEKPRGFAEPGMTCRAVYERGGLCGGVTFLVSRAALERMYEAGQSADDFRQEFIASIPAADGGASDMATSCMLYARGIAMVAPSSLVRGFGELKLRDAHSDNEIRQEIRAWKKERGNDPTFTMHLPVKKNEIPTYIHALDHTHSLVEVVSSGNMSASDQVDTASEQTMTMQHADWIVRIVNIVDKELAN